jgi:hypothetical protein
MTTLSRERHLHLQVLSPETVRKEMMTMTHLCKGSAMQS